MVRVICSNYQSLGSLWAVFGQSLASLWEFRHLYE
jgi:hypothetical protein